MGRFRGHGGCRPRECPRGGARGAPRAGQPGRDGRLGGWGPAAPRGAPPPGGAPRAGGGAPPPAELQGRYALWAVRAPGTGREGSAS